MAELVALVPFGRTTLAAGTNWVPLRGRGVPQPTRREVAALRAEVRQFYPEPSGIQPIAWTCIKTERQPRGRKPDVLSHVYGRRELGVDGLLFAIPGKASFMFELAQEVVRRAAQQHGRADRSRATGRSP